MAEPIKEWPRGPYREHYFKQLELDRAGKQFQLIAPSTLFLTADDGRYRLGFGGALIIPREKGSRFDVGLGYHYFPFSEVGFTGHRLSLFADFPEFTSLGHIRGGIYSELGSLTSFDKLKGDFSAGIDIEIGISLVPASWRSHFDFTLDFLASLGMGKPEFVEKMLGGGLSVWWVF